MHCCLLDYHPRRHVVEYDEGGIEEEYPKEDPEIPVNDMLWQRQVNKTLPDEFFHSREGVPVKITFWTSEILMPSSRDANVSCGLLINQHEYEDRARRQTAMTVPNLYLRKRLLLTSVPSQF